MGEYHGSPESMMERLDQYRILLLANSFLNEAAHARCLSIVLNKSESIVPLKK